MVSNPVIHIITCIMSSQHSGNQQISGSVPTSLRCQVWSWASRLCKCASVTLALPFSCPSKWRRSYVTIRCVFSPTAERRSKHLATVGTSTATSVDRGSIVTCATNFTGLTTVVKKCFTVCCQLEQSDSTVSRSRCIWHFCSVSVTKHRSKSRRWAPVYAPIGAHRYMTPFIFILCLWLMDRTEPDNYSSTLNIFYV